MGNGLIQDGRFTSAQTELRCPRETQKERSIKQLCIISAH